MGAIVVSVGWLGLVGKTDTLVSLLGLMRGHCVVLSGCWSVVGVIMVRMLEGFLGFDQLDLTVAGSCRL